MNLYYKFVPVFDEKNKPCKIKQLKNTLSMKKKIYTRPTFDVVEYHMSQITCTSVHKVSSSDTGLNYGGGGNGPARGKSSIWDEE